MKANAQVGSITSSAPRDPDSVLSASQSASVSAPTERSWVGALYEREAIAEITENCQVSRDARLKARGLAPDVQKD
jgi:hypothetical protein